MRWATGSAGTQTWCAARLSVVRGFARYLHTLDPATEVPPAGLLTYRRRRALCARAGKSTGRSCLMSAATVLSSTLRRFRPGQDLVHAALLRFGSTGTVSAGIARESH